MKVAKFGIPVLAAVVAITMASCAGLGKGMSKKELVGKTLNNWKTAVEAANLDAMMATYSEKYQGENGGKAELRKYLQGVIDQGYLQNAKVDLSKASEDFKRGVCTVSPIFLSSARGGITIQLTLKRDKDKVWRIVGSETG